MKKFELTGESINILDKTLYRIKALRDFSNVKKGDLGGFIEKETNLSHEGNCWIYDNATVYDNARVFGNAKVYDIAKVFGYATVSDNALVSGYATVSDNALVSGNAWVFDNAKVYDIARISGYALVSGKFDKTPLQIAGTRHYFNVSAKNKITIGCVTKSFDEWLENYEDIGKEFGYSDKEIDEYYKYINLAIELNG